VVDTPSLCTFIFPAIVDRSPLTVAISSAVPSPVLARRVRSRIEAMLPAATADIARFARLHRERVSPCLSHEDARRRLWEKIIDGPIAQLLLIESLAGGGAGPGGGALGAGGAGSR
jgi:uroporphyrin-III C-methyltransferase/precorrin-2 dehydrogenase/sirohydrochlorin ferrochelatase